MDKFDEIKPYLVMLLCLSKQYDNIEESERKTTLNNTIRLIVNQMIEKIDMKFDYVEALSNLEDK